MTLSGAVRPPSGRCCGHPASNKLPAVQGNRSTALGGASGRPQRARCGRASLELSRGAVAVAREVLRCYWRHVLADHPVRARGAARAPSPDPAAPGLRPRPRDQLAPVRGARVSGLRERSRAELMDTERVAPTPSRRISMTSSGSTLDRRLPHHAGLAGAAAQGPRARNGSFCGRRGSGYGDMLRRIAAWG